MKENQLKKEENEPETFPTSLHPHKLQIINCDDGWSCNGRSQPGGCQSKITGFSQTFGMTRYHCKACEFDLCEKCLNTPVEQLEKEQKKGNEEKDTKVEKYY